MKKFLLLFVLVSISSFSIFSSDNSSDLARYNPRERLGFSVSYFGEFIFTHPGVSIGFEYIVYKNKKNWFNFLLASNIGWYIHYLNHNAIFFDSQVAFRFITPKGFYGDLFLGIGYLHTWAYGEIYTGVDNSGNLIKKMNYGYPHLMLNASITLFGWDFYNLTGFPILTYLRMCFFGEYPYNNYILPHTAIQIGITYQLRKINVRKKKA